jgi:hypothetical protein
MESAKGIPILASAAVSIDFASVQTVATVKMLALKPRPALVVLRVQPLVDTGSESMDIVCQILNGETAEGGATLAQQILAAAGLPGRNIMITKTSIFGCKELPCAKPGLKPDFDIVPGSATATALGDVILYAVK